MNWLSLRNNRLKEVQDCMKITNHFTGIYRIYPSLIKENRRMSTCNRLDLQTLGSQPVMPKNLPDHWSSVQEGRFLGYFSWSRSNDRGEPAVSYRWTGWSYFKTTGKLQIILEKSIEHIQLNKNETEDVNMFSPVGLANTRIGSQPVIMPKNLPDHCRDPSLGFRV